MKIRKSYVWAGLISLGIAAWLASGELMSTPTPATDGAEKAASGLFRVQVREIAAQPRQAFLTVRGRTEAIRSVEVRARTAGIVEEVPHQEGDHVKAGDLLCRLDVAARQTQLAEARARLASARIEADAAEKLATDKFVARTTLAAKRAAHDAAKASVDGMEREIGYTAITAPVEGTIASRPANQGSFLQVGGQCAQLLVLDPLVVVGHVAEREVSRLKVDMAGSATLVTGETVEGRIRFIAPSAEEATRTFRIELEVANPGRALRDGVTSDIRIPLGESLAHKFSPALLGLDDAGRIGVRILDDGNRVRFVPVTILGDDKDGVWVDGLPEQATLVTIGQEFVTDGQVVQPVEESLADATEPTR
jgi:multidrug efflux system membrane fusion protein